MNITKKIKKNAGAFLADTRGVDIADLIEEDLDGIDLQRIDEAGAVARPETIGRFYVEDELEELTAGQRPAWNAQGQSQARPHLARAAGNELHADDQTYATELSKELVGESKDDLREVRRVLGPHSRRTRKDKWMYFGRTGLLLTGDVAGITGGAIALGELPGLALMQGTSAGVAALSSGLLGRELKDMRLARKRAMDLQPILDKPETERTDDERSTLRYAHELRGPDDGESIGKLAIYMGLTIAGLVTTSIFALRAATDSLITGVVFGALAAAIALASGLNTYEFTDSASDLIENKEQAFKKDVKRLAKLGKGGARSVHASDTATAVSIQEEHQLLGEAAERRMASYAPRVLRNNTGVAGHGYPPKSAPSKPVTQTTAGGEREPASATSNNGNGNGHHAQEGGAR